MSSIFYKPELLWIFEDRVFFFLSFFFFFQAEDGIRDLTVTGVQTCALPISRRSVLVVREEPSRSNSPSSSTRRSFGCWASGRFATSSRNSVPPSASSHRPMKSEERRVGKECRSRWSPYP